MDTKQIRAIITEHFRNSLKTLHRDGFVVGLSGGIDSTLTAHLAVEAVGPARVLGVVMPERESSPESKELGVAVAERLGIDYEEVDLTKHLEAVDAYNKRDNIVLRYFDSYRPGRHRVGISLRQDLTGSSMPPLHYLVVPHQIQGYTASKCSDPELIISDYAHIPGLTPCLSARLTCTL